MGTNTDISTNSENGDGVDFTLEPNVTNCKNCEQEHEIGYEFCPHCGQKTNEDLTVGVLFYNTISNYFSFDARFFKSFIPLMFKPGTLAKRFIEGKRLLYLHPAQMYLFISVVFFFLFSIVTRDFINKTDNVLEEGFNNEKVKDTVQKSILDSADVAKITAPLKNNELITGMDQEELKTLDSIITSNANGQNVPTMDFGFNSKKVDSLVALKAPEGEIYKAMGMKDDAGMITQRFYKQALKIYSQSGKGVFQAFIDSIPISMFIVLPIFAFILKILFFRRGPFAHHLVFSFYYYSFLFTVFSIIAIVNMIWEIPDWIDWLVAISTFLYLLIAIKRFYGQGYFLSFFKTSVATFVYMIFVVPIALIVMSLGAFFFY
jgi:hypothetical protein